MSPPHTPPLTPSPSAPALGRGPSTLTPGLCLQNKRDRDAVDKLLKDLDANGDAEVDFNEFMVFVAALTAACHKYFEQAGLH